MRIREVKAKQILSTYKEQDTYFGFKYTMNLYRGCEHNCIYCDSRSQCYGIEDFNDIIIKTNAIELLRTELASKRIVGTVGTGAMCDCYTKAEEYLKMTRQALKTIEQFRFPLHIITKSDMVIRDMDIIKDISNIYSAVTFTITTAYDDISLKVEPDAPVSSKRLAAMKILSNNSIYTGISMMPILPFIEDSEKNIRDIIRLGAENGAKYIIPAFGVTTRDRQKAYFYKKLEESFPGVKEKYISNYGDSYGCYPLNGKHLKTVLKNECEKYGISIGIKQYKIAENMEQISFFDMID